MIIFIYRNLSNIFYSSVKDISLLKENINNALWLSQINNYQNELVSVFCN